LLLTSLSPAEGIAEGSARKVFDSTAILFRLYMFILPAGSKTAPV
jgi:hypothetical protein